MRLEDLTDEDYACLEKHFGLSAAHAAGWLKGSPILEGSFVKNVFEMEFKDIPLIYNHWKTLIERAVLNFRLEVGK